MNPYRQSIAKYCWAVAIAVSLLFYLNFGKGTYNFYGDALGYYLYLPSTFIYHNQTSLDQFPKDKGINPFIFSYVEDLGRNNRTPKGYVLISYTYGVALMELPFFLAAHTWELTKGGPANGFSETYRNAIALSTVVYALLGLWLTYNALRHNFSKEVASLTTCLIFIGTNLFWFVTRQHGMAHVPLFCLFALLLLLTFRIHECGRWWHFAVLGLIVGLITVIRPTDGLCALIPLCYTTGTHFFKDRLRYLWQNRVGVILAGICFALALIPQLLYWKWLTGYHIYDSYGPGQRFDLIHPKLWMGLFSARNGWLCYSPLMILSLTGLFAKKLSSLRIGMLLFLILYIWIIYSWYVPNYINGFGSRPMVDVCALLAFPLAASIEWISYRTLPLKAGLVLLIILFVTINLSYSIQQGLGILSSDNSNYQYNLGMMFRYRMRPADLAVWDLGVRQPNPQRLQFVYGKQTSFKDSVVSENIIDDTTGSGEPKVYYVLASTEYPTLSLTIPYDSIANKHATWIRFSGRFMLPEYVSSMWDNTGLVIQIKRADAILSWHALRLNNKVGLPEHSNTPLTLFDFKNGIWGEAHGYLPIPDGVRKGDLIIINIWNAAHKPLYISSLQLQCFTNAHGNMSRE